MRSILVSQLTQVFHAYSVGALILVGLSVLFPITFLDQRIAYIGIGWFILAAVYFATGAGVPTEQQWQPRRAFVFGALAALVVFAYLLRLSFQGSSVVPVGYDYGFYSATMTEYEQAAPIVPEEELPAWMRDQFEPGLFLLHDVMFQIAGLTAYNHLRWLFPLLSSLALLPLYAVARAYLGTAAGLTAAALYAASFTQFTVFQYLYEKNVLGLWIFLCLAFALQKRRFVLMGILLGALGIWHRPTFLLAAVSLPIVGALAIVKGDNVRRWLLAAAISLPLFLPLWIMRSEHYFDLGIRVVKIAGDNVGSAFPEGSGTFLTFIEYQNAAVTYLPLAVAGVVLAIRKGNGLFPATAFALSFLNVTLQLFFFNRFIIMLDFLSFLLVGVAVAASLPPMRTWLRPTLIGVLVFLTAIPTIQEAARDPGPPYLWVDDGQHEGIAWIRENTEENATILGSNLDSPYVIAASERRTFGPGLFDDPHSAVEWRRFFGTDDPSEIAAHLAAYNGPVYVYHAEGHGPGLGMAKFVEPQFSLVYDAKEAKVWRYNP